MKYNPHIDGLRAISIIAILFYHAEFNFAKNGYLGVDIFFVISGYLITYSIIESKNFTYKLFYLKRIRRIFPAFLIMCCISTVFSWFLLTPRELIDYGNSLIASINMFSNFYFWKTQNYFSESSQLKPLIHTWSLSIEEQFYIIFPFFLIFISKFPKHFIIIIVITIISILLQIAINFMGKEALSFYFPVLRAWEFLVGTIGAIVQKNYYIQNNKHLNKLYVFTGYFLLIYSLSPLFENKSIIKNLISCLGTLFLILFSSSNNSGKYLSNKFLQFIGIISYSIYLYHQPIFSFSRHYYIEINNLQYILLIIFSILVGAFSYFAIERNYKKISNNALLIQFIVLWLILTSAGIIFKLNYGFPERYNIDKLSILNYENYDYEKYLRYHACLISDKTNFKSFPIECYGNINKKSKLVIWGDSHAAGLFYGFSRLRKDVAQFTVTSCPPFIDTKHNKPECNKLNSMILDEIGILKPNELYLHAHWSNYNQNSIHSLILTIDKIKNISPNTNINIIGNTPYWSKSLPVLLTKYSDYIDVKGDFIVFDSPTIKISDKYLELISSSLGVNFISAFDILCLDKLCQIKSSDNVNINALFFYDNEHLTKEGSLFLSKKILIN